MCYNFFYYTFEGVLNTYKTTFSISFFFFCRCCNLSDNDNLLLKWLYLHRHGENKKVQFKKIN